MRGNKKYLDFCLLKLMAMIIVSLGSESDIPAGALSGVGGCWCVGSCLRARELMESFAVDLFRATNFSEDK